MRRLLQLVLALVLVAVGGVQAWRRWAPPTEQPIPKGAEVRQWSVTTCGPACVATILNVYRLTWSRDGLERECRLRPEGTSLYDLQQAFRAHGLDASGLQVLTPAALQRLPRPFVAYLVEGHFVVVERADGRQLSVFDPTSGAVGSVSPRALLTSGHGWVLTVSPRRSWMESVFAPQP